MLLMIHIDICLVQVELAIGVSTLPMSECWSNRLTVLPYSFDLLCSSAPSYFTYLVSIVLSSSLEFSSSSQLLAIYHGADLLLGFVLAPLLSSEQLLRTSARILCDRLITRSHV